MTRDGSGAVLVELLVATACAGLVGAAVLTLLAGAGHLGRRALLRVEAIALARACVEAIEREVRRAGVGLEGAAEVIDAGGASKVVAGDRRSLAVVVATGPPVEVANAPGGWLATGAGAPGIGQRVAALGTAASPAPTGVVTERVRGGSRWLVRVAWTGQTAEPRALLPFRIRRLALDAAAGTLRRRDDAGPWIPVVDGVAALTLGFASVEADGVTGGGASSHVSIRCETSAGEQPATAFAWARVGDR